VGKKKWLNQRIQGEELSQRKKKKKCFSSKRMAFENHWSLKKTWQLSWQQSPKTQKWKTNRGSINLPHQHIQKTSNCALCQGSWCTRAQPPLVKKKKKDDDHREAHRMIHRGGEVRSGGRPTDREKNFLRSPLSRTTAGNEEKKTNN